MATPTTTTKMMMMMMMTVNGDDEDDDDDDVTVVNNVIYPAEKCIIKALTSIRPILPHASIDCVMIQYLRSGKLKYCQIYDIVLSMFILSFIFVIACDFS